MNGMLESELNALQSTSAIDRKVRGVDRPSFAKSWNGTEVPFWDRFHCEGKAEATINVVQNFYKRQNYVCLGIGTSD